LAKVVVIWDSILFYRTYAETGFLYEKSWFEPFYPGQKPGF